MFGSAVDSPEYRQAQQSVHIAEVDVAYTEFYPRNKRYQCIFPQGMPASESFTEPRPPLWYFVENCLKEDNIVAFEHGAFDNELIQQELVLHPQVQPRERFQALEVGHQEQQSAKVAQDLPPSKDEHDRFYVQLSPDRELPYRVCNESDDNDNAVMLNFEANDQESGEVSEYSPRLIEDTEAEVEVEDRLDRQVHERLVDDTSNSAGEVDAMVIYADASRTLGPSGPTKPQGQEQPANGSRPRVLADLGHEDLDAQLRYFYITQNTQDFDLSSMPVRCLVCARVGHMAQECPTLTCADCGSYNDHFVPFCPQKKKCFKCRGQGHDSTKCPSKLKIAASEIACDLCQDTGHTENDCELLWRSSGPSKVLNSHDQRLTHVSCYECGNRSHLGNDCPSRRPGKPMGSGTWSMTGKKSSTCLSKSFSKAGLAIKGRAQQPQQSEPINISSDSDDHGGLIQKKVPGPTNRGSIRISAPGQTDNLYPRQNPMNEQYGLQQVETKNNGRVYQHGDNYPYLYPPSPHYQSHLYPGSRSRPNPDYRPPPPRPDYTLPGHPGTRSRPNPNYQPPHQTYQPMPSAGHNAWRQFKR